MSSRKNSQKTVDVKKEILKRFRKGESQIGRYCANNNIGQISQITMTIESLKSEKIVIAPIERKHVVIKPQSEKLEELIYEFLKLAREKGRCITRRLEIFSH